MATSTTKKAPSRSRSKAKKGEKLRTGIRILVEDLRIGDKIVTRWHKSTAEAKGGDLTEDEVMDVLRGEDEGRYVAASHEVTSFTECPSQWRTHVHVNKKDCYDMRTYVWVVKE